MSTESSLLRRRKIASIAAVFIIMLIIVGVYADDASMEFALLSSDIAAHNNKLSVVTHRKLLNHGGKGDVVEEEKRIWRAKCSKSDISISQGPAKSLSGIPTFTVEIMNTCTSGCSISAIHLRCGWFSSARVVNPLIFKRLEFDDCVVNDGKPLANGHSISFQYSNSVPYPLSVNSVNC